MGRYKFKARGDGVTHLPGGSVGQRSYDGGKEGRSVIRNWEGARECVAERI